MPAPPTFRKQHPGDPHIITLVLASPTMRFSDLDDYSENSSVPHISMIPDVAQVQIYGAAKFAVRVQVDPNRLALGWGAGSDARKPLGMAVVGGPTFSQLMTLYLTPMIYTYMAALLERCRELFGAQAALSRVSHG